MWAVDTGPQTWTWDGDAAERAQAGAKMQHRGKRLIGTQTQALSQLSVHNYQERQADTEGGRPSPALWFQCLEGQEKMEP